VIFVQKGNTGNIKAVTKLGILCTNNDVDLVGDIVSLVRPSSERSLPTCLSLDVEEPEAN